MKKILLYLLVILIIAPGCSKKKRPHTIKKNPALAQARKALKRYHQALRKYNADIKAQASKLKGVDLMRRALKAMIELAKKHVKNFIAIKRNFAKTKAGQQAGMAWRISRAAIQYHQRGDLARFISEIKKTMKREPNGNLADDAHFYLNMVVYLEMTRFFVAIASVNPVARRNIARTLANALLPDHDRIKPAAKLREIWRRVCFSFVGAPCNKARGSKLERLAGQGLYRAIFGGLARLPRRYPSTPIKYILKAVLPFYARAKPFLAELDQEPLLPPIRGKAIRQISDLLRTKTGAQWVYRLFGGKKQIAIKIVGKGAGGINVKSTRPGGRELKEQWRITDHSFQQGQNREPLRNPIHRGLSWAKGERRYRILALNRTVETPAGTFNKCVAVEEAFKNQTFTRFYAPAVGLIRWTELTRGSEGRTATWKRVHDYRLISYQ